MSMPPPAPRRHARAATLKPLVLPTRATPRRRRLNALDVVCLQMIGAFAAGLGACELYAVLTGAAHVTVIFGGNG